MPLPSDLAQELIDTILDFLHDDRESLLSSSLVSRKWVPAPRYHIFEQIAINHLVTGRQGRFRDTAHKFLAICSSPHCTILSSVHNVVLNIDTELAPTSAGSLLEKVIHVLARAPVNKILLIDHTLSLDRPMSVSWITPLFPDLHEFVYNALYHVAQDVLALVASFPILRILSVYSSTPGPSTIDITQPTLSRTIPPAVFAHLHTLRLRLSSHQAVLSWLQSAADSLRLETFDLNVFHPYHNGWGPVAALNSVLHANGESLRHFSLRVTYEDSDDEPDEVDDELRLTKAADGEVDLSGLINLRSLQLYSHSVEAICGALASLPGRPPTLEILEVDFSTWIYYDFIPCQCDAGFLVHEFSAVMRGDQFARLTTFDIRVPEFFGDAGRTALTEYFPRWKGTEVLYVGYIESSPSQVDLWETAEDLVFGSTGV